MTMRGVCDAWIVDLTTHVDELANVVVHRYASWSLERFAANTGERHLAVWPEPAPLRIEPFTTGQVGSDYATTAYGCAVWEDASDEISRFADDEAANGAWLDLAESIEARFRVQANLAAGNTGSLTALNGITWGIQGNVRWLVVSFTNAAPVAFT